jgi:hypothetical protein
VPVRARTGTTAPLVMPAATGAQAFARTVALPKKEEEAEDDTIVPMQPQTVPVTGPITRGPHPNLPPQGEGARTAVVPPPPVGQGRGGGRFALLIAAFLAFVVVAAGAAWMIGSRSAKPVVTAQPAAPVQIQPDSAFTATAPPPPVAASDPAVAAVTPPVVRLQRPVVKPTSRPAPPVDDKARAAEGAAATAVTRDGPATPREACGSRVFMALALCMEAQCESPRFKGHPQCKKVLARLERRRRGESGD